jgi:ABC-type transport system substrate-binding protein
MKLVGRLCLAFCMLCAAVPCHAEKTLRYAFMAAETGFDPAQLTDSFSRYVTSNIFDAPLRHVWFGDGAVECNTLTELPTVSSDYTTFTFHLKPGIFFTPDAAFNGKPRELVADDYVYSFKRYYDPRWKSQVYGALESYGITSLEKLRNDAIKSGHFDYDTPVEGIRTLDRYTWQIKLSKPAPRFATDNYYDASIMGAVAREVVEKYGDAIMEHPVGTGAFMLSDWVCSSHMTLVKNPHYRDDFYHVNAATGDAQAERFAQQHNGKKMPFIDKVEISVIEESQPRWLAFVNAETDVLTPDVPTDLVPLAYPGNKLAPNLAKQGIEVQRTALVRNSLVIFNMDDPVIGGYSPDKVALRRAVSLGLDIPAVIANVFKYQAIPAQTLIYPHQLGYDPTLRTEMGQHDVARANAMLDSYGYLPRNGSQWRDLPDGTPFTLTELDNGTQRDRILDEILKKSFDSIGIQIAFSTHQFPENLKAAQTGNYQIWFLGNSSTSPDPSDDLKGYYGPAAGGDNLTRFALPQYDALFHQQNELPDGPARMALILRMRDLVNAYAPAKLAYHQIAIELWHPWLKGFYFDPFLDDWWRYVDIDENAQRPHLQ